MNIPTPVTQTLDSRSNAANSQAATRHIELRIDGMTCAHCPPAIEKAIAAVPGVTLGAGQPSDQHGEDRLRAFANKNRLNPASGAHGRLYRRTATTRIPIKNMHCSSCITRIELALRMTPGIVPPAQASVRTPPTSNTSRKKVDFQDIHKAIELAGYRVAEPKITPKSETLDPAEAANEEEYRTLMRKFWFAAAVSVPVMALSYPDMIPGLRDWMPMGSETRRIVWALLGVLSLPVLVWAGSQFFTGLWDGLKHRAANMNTLISIGISAAFAYSIVSVARPRIFPDMKLAEVFWDVTDVVVALVVLGLALEIKAKGRTSQAIKKLIGLRQRPRG